MRTLVYAVYSALLLGAYALTALPPSKGPKPVLVSAPRTPYQVRRGRLEGLSRLDAASVAGARHDWHRIFAGPVPPWLYGRSRSGGGYYGGGGSYYGGRRSYGGGGWFGGK